MLHLAGQDAAALARKAGISLADARRITGAVIGRGTGLRDARNVRREVLDRVAALATPGELRRVEVVDARDGFRPDPSPHRHWYFLGAGLTLWSCWQASTAVGVFLGARVPESWSLDFTLPLTFIALVFPGLRDRPAAAAALAAGILAVLAAGLPYKLGLLAAALVGIVAGLAVEGRRA